MKKAIWLLCLELTSFLTIVSLYFISQTQSKTGNGFKRTYQFHILTSVRKKRIEKNMYGISGTGKSSLFLAINNVPLYGLRISDDLTDSQHFKIRIDSGIKIPVAGTQLQIDSPFVFICSGTLPAIFQGKFPDSFVHRISLPLPYFTIVAPFNQHSFALRVLESKRKQYILAKSSRKETTYATNILVRQVDGIFCTDGMLVYNKDKSRIVYVYYYRNQYLLLDTNLHLIYQGKTIDTISIAKIKVAIDNKTESMTMSSPPLVVNSNSASWKNWLFIQSPRSAENEKLEDLKANSVIDVYDLQKGTYIFSFYLSNPYSKKLKEFRVINNRLIALYDEWIYSYELNTSYFKE
jgi:hypothetical protein